MFQLHKDKYADASFYTRLTLIEKEFPGAAILLHKHGVVPKVKMNPTNYICRTMDLYLESCLWVKNVDLRPIPLYSHSHIFWKCASPRDDEERPCKVLWKTHPRTQVNELSLFISYKRSLIYCPRKSLDIWYTSQSSSKIPVLLTWKSPVFNCLSHSYFKAFQDLWTNERLLNVIEQFIGPEIAGHPVWNLRTKVSRNQLQCTTSI